MANLIDLTCIGNFFHSEALDLVALGALHQGCAYCTAGVSLSAGKPYLQASAILVAALWAKAMSLWVWPKYKSTPLLLVFIRFNSV
jgi:hypothetical protein